MASSSSSSASASAAAPVEVDPSLWRAVSGTLIQIPSVNSYVYYFPEGHAEHCSESAAEIVKRCNSVLKRPMVPCEVVSVQYLCDPGYDQLYVKFVLQPLQPLGPRPIGGGSGDDEEEEKEKDLIRDEMAIYAKVLTASDVNSGGGFSVPMVCAEVIFMKGDLEEAVKMKDVCGKVWEMRHVYRGGRHMLTTGWSKFVKEKGVVVGDWVVLVKRRENGEVFMGVRRGVKGGDGEMIVEALGRASEEKAFTVRYYPRVGYPEYVVKAERVKRCLRRSWKAGMKVEMMAETDDSSRLTCHRGAVESTFPEEGGPWPASPWRMLQVGWDEGDILPNLTRRLNPWQVECVPLVPLKRRLIRDTTDDDDDEQQQQQQQSATCRVRLIPPVDHTTLLPIPFPVPTPMMKQEEEEVSVPISTPMMKQEEEEVSVPISTPMMKQEEFSVQVKQEAPPPIKQEVKQEEVKVEPKVEPKVEVGATPPSSSTTLHPSPSPSPSPSPPNSFFSFQLFGNIIHVPAPPADRTTTP